MNRLILKLKAVWFLLTSKGYILTYVKNPDDEEMNAGFIFSGLDAEQIVMFSDCLADEIEAEIEEEENKIMANKIGQGMINYINLN